MQDQRDVFRFGGTWPRSGAFRSAEKSEGASASFWIRRERQHDDPELFRRSDHGRGASLFDDERLSTQIAHIEFEFIGPIGGVERRRGRAGAIAMNAVAISGPFGRTMATRSLRPIPNRFSEEIVSAMSALRP